MNTHRSMLIAIVLAIHTPALAADDSPVKVELLADVAAVEPGGTFTVGVRLTMKAGWHTYWANPGESGAATTIQLKLPNGFTAGAVQWPTPHKYGGGRDEFVTYGYAKVVLLMVDVTAPQTLKPNTAIRIEAAIGWLACDVKTCVPGASDQRLAITAGKERAAANTKLFKAWRKKLPIPLAKAADWLTIKPSKTHKISIKWKKSVSEVDWHPQTAEDQLVQDLQVTTKDQVTNIDYKAQQLEKRDKPVTKLPGILVFMDSAGHRRAVALAGPMLLNK